MPNPETLLERHLTERVRAVGGFSMKLAPTTAGLPDRLVLLPRGRIFLVELKAPGGRLRPVQRVWHARFLAIGIRVVVLTGRTEVDGWMDAQT